MLFGLFGYKSNGFEKRFSLDVILKTQGMNIFEEQVGEYWRKFDLNASIDAACVLGRPYGVAEIGLLGDSHAGSLLHVLNIMAIKSNIQVKNYSYRSCPPLITADPSSQGSGRICSDLRKSFFATLKNDPDSLPNKIIISARWPFLVEKGRFDNGEGGVESGGPWVWSLGGNQESYLENMRSEIVFSIESIINSGKTVILIYPVPEMGWDVPKMLSRRMIFGDEVKDDLGSVSYDAFLKRNKNAIEILDSINGGDRLIRVKPHEILCNTLLKGRCVAHINGHSLYFDDNHLSNKGAEIILREVFKNL